MTQLPDGSGCFTATILSNEEALALPLKERPINHRISSEMYHAVFEHIGEASMAWSPNTGSAVFNSEMASDVAVRLCFKIANELEKSTQELQDEILESQSRLEKALADQRRNLCAESDALIEQLKQERALTLKAFEDAATANKTYRKADAEISELRDEIELKSACINGMRDTGVKAWNSAIDSVLALYAPDGNPCVWHRKIEGLRQNENMPELIKKPDSMGICQACGANTDSWHFCHDYGTWR